MNKINVRNVEKRRNKKQIIKIPRGIDLEFY